MPIEKVSIWAVIVVAFLDKYYPLGTILKLKSEIFQFIQGHDEPLYEAFARFKALLRKCSNHSFTVDHQVGILYNGFNEKICVMLDSGANGGFLRKTGEDVMAVIEEFATNCMGWSNGSAPSHPSGSRGEHPSGSCGWNHEWFSSESFKRNFRPLL